MSEPLLPEEALLGFVRDQRWFGSKTSDVIGARLVDSARLGAGPHPLVDALYEIRYGAGTHDLYQVVVGEGEGDVPGPAIASGEGRTRYEAAADPAFARELVDLMARGAMLETGDGTIEFCAMTPGSREGSSVRNVHALGVEQTNTSIVIDDELIVKLYRRVDAGVNPELEMLHFFATHGFENVPRLEGWWSYAGSLFSGSLGMVQEFVSGAIDGWELAQQQVVADPAAFLGRTRRLGEVIGQMHAVLASEPNDPAFAP